MQLLALVLGRDGVVTGTVARLNVRAAVGGGSGTAFGCVPVGRNSRQHRGAPRPPRSKPLKPQARKRTPRPQTPQTPAGPGAPRLLQGPLPLRGDRQVTPFGRPPAPAPAPARWRLAGRRDRVRGRVHAGTGTGLHPDHYAPAPKALPQTERGSARAALEFEGLRSQELARPRRPEPLALPERNAACSFLCVLSAAAARQSARCWREVGTFCLPSPQASHRV